MQTPYAGTLKPDGNPWQASALHRKRLSRFEQGKDDFIENIDDECIRYDDGRVAANEGLIEEIQTRGLRRTNKETGIDRKTIRRILNRQNVKTSTLAKVVIGLRQEKGRVE